MDRGKILVQGSLDQLLFANNSKEIIEFSTQNMIPDNFFCGEGVIKTIWDEESKNGKLIVQSIVNQLPDFLKKVNENGITLSRLECRKLTLDDLFISMTGKHLTEN